MKLTKQMRQYFAEIGSRGAQKQSAAMTPKQRTRRAKLAATARWGRKGK